MGDGDYKRTTKKQNRSVLPKRGQVLKGILKDLFVSTTKIGSMRGENEGFGGGLSSSSSSTPAATPSGYNSDAASES